MSHPFFDVPGPWVIGHRGSAGTHPENTLRSFEEALSAGAHVLETDLQATRDGDPILLHDEEVDRVTDGTGWAADFEWSALRRLDAGARFESNSGDRPYAHTGFRIPLLAEAFEAFPEARFNIEIKTPDERATRATLDLVHRFDRADRTLLTAGEDAVMTRLRALTAEHEACPALGASLGDIVAAVSSALEGTPMPDGVTALQIPADFAGRPLATPELVSHAHAAGVAVHVWTINDVVEIDRLLEMGVDGIVTDFPRRMSLHLESEPLS